MSETYKPPYQVDMADIPKSITPKDQGEDCCICEVDVDLLKRMYPDFKEHNSVGKATVRFGNDVRRNQNIVVSNPDMGLTVDPTRPLIMIQPDTTSLFLTHGDLLLSNYYPELPCIAQIDVVPTEKGECMDVIVLQPHIHLGKQHHQFLEELALLNKQREARIFGEHEPTKKSYSMER